MEQIAIGSESKMKRKVINVSVKRQITIPQKYFDALGIGNKVECILQEDGILLRPVQDSNDGELSEQILEDLISQGYSGQELLQRFKEQRKKIRPAVKKLIKEADTLVREDEGKVSMDELFGTEE